MIYLLSIIAPFCTNFWVVYTHTQYFIILDYSIEITYSGEKLKLASVTPLASLINPIIPNYQLTFVISICG